MSKVDIGRIAGLHTEDVGLQASAAGGGHRD